MVEPDLIPDLVVSSAAALGLLIVRSQIGPRADGLSWRFRLILLVTALFYMFRVADWLFAIGVLRFLTIVTAATIPFTALLLAEGLLRRHAPRGVKFAAALGASLFCLAAFAVPITRTPGFLTLFLAYQALVFAVAFGMVLTRDRASLSPPENRFANRVMFVGPFILVLLATDYGAFGMWDLPALSGLTALMIAWIASTSEARAATGAFLTLALGALVAVSVGTALALGMRFAWSGTETLEAAIMLVAVILALMVWLSSAALRRARSRASLEFALAGTDSLSDFMATIVDHGLSEGFALLGEQDLRDYDTALLVSALGGRGAVSQAHLPNTPADDTRAESQIRALLSRFAARDIFLISLSPLQLAIGAPDGLGGKTGSDTRAAFAIARLIAERDAKEERTA